MRGRPSHRAYRALVVALAALLLAHTHAGAAASVTSSDRIWFSPNPGTLDMLRMFERPDEWARARALIGVYNITQQHTGVIDDRIVGPNTYAALRQADAFRRLKTWGIKLSVGVGVVKEFYCTPDARGMNQAIKDTSAAIDAVTSAGGHVDFLSMDEPWVSGRSRACGGPALEPTADRVALYMKSISAAYPDVEIGLIEAYPFSSATAIESMLTLLKSRAVSPAFLHMDVDWHALPAGAFETDMRRLQSTCRSAGIPFGIIITGYNGDADALFALDAAGIAHHIARAFGTWNAMPDHIIFDSWVESRTGLRITPANLPETRPYTHTNILLQIFRYLRGVQGNTTGVAVPRARLDVSAPISVP